MKLCSSQVIWYIIAELPEIISYKYPNHRKL
jgi:hypothetical protein